MSGRARDLPRATLLVSFAVFILGALRAWTRPVVSDGAFRLVDAGGAWWTGDLASFASPPGGHDAPWLGAVVTAAGALFSGSQAQLVRPVAALLLGAAAVVLARGLLRTVDRAGLLLGVALLLLPPAFATSFVVRPDAALGGTLLLAAMVRTDRRGRSALGLALAWAAVLATPAALPAALVLHLLPDAADGRPRPGRAPGDPRLLVGPLAVVALVALLSSSLPDGAHGQVLAGLGAGLAPPFAASDSTLAALRGTWVAGLLILVPLVGPSLARGAGVSPAVHGAWAAAALTSLVVSGEGAFAERSAALVPGACWLTARVVAALPDPGRAPGAPSRPVLLALALPLALLVLAEPADRRARAALGAESARSSQLASLVESGPGGWPAGAFAARRTGALAAHSSRAVRPFARSPRETLEPRATPPPAIVVLGGGARPATPTEARLVRDDRFPVGWAPRTVQRGADGTIPDVVWIRRPRPAPAPHGEGYARELADGMAARDSGDPDAAARALDAAVGLEPDGLGLAREERGLLAMSTGDTALADSLFAEARSDPQTARARVHLADAALTSGDIRRADSLLAEAGTWAPGTPALHAVQARLFAETGHREEALAASAQAVRSEPDRVRSLLNHGTLLWATGETKAARQAWNRAVALDVTVVRFLGDFRHAPDDAPAPPLLPVLGPIGPLAPEPPPPSPESETEPRKAEP